jgi:hypothetical protein
MNQLLSRPHPRPRRVPIAVRAPNGPGPHDAVVERLVDAVARCVPHAFGTLYRVLAPHLLQQIRTWLSEPAMARGVLWGTFVEVSWMARHHSPATGTGRAWITAVAARRAAEQDRLCSAADASWQATLGRTRDEQNRAALCALLSAPPGRRPHRRGPRRSPTRVTQVHRRHGP